MYFATATSVWGCLGASVRVFSCSRVCRDGEINEEEFSVDTSFKNVIFCDHLPVVPAEKFDKLVSVLKKIFGQIGNIREGAPLSARAASIAK